MEPLNFGLLKEWLEEKKFFRVKDALTNRNEVDIAEFLEDLPPEKMAVVFRMLPKEMAADVFAELSVETQQTIIESVTDTEISQIMNDLFVDDMVDMLEELPANVVKRVLRNATPEKRAMINQFLRYPEDSAGSIMTAEFVDLRKTMTVGAAIRKIRSTGLNKETVYTCYVTDANRRLEGEVSVKDLLMAEDEAGIESVMDANMISVVTTENQEETAKLFSKYGLLSIPVVDEENRLVGIVTVDDAVEVMEQEATEDFERMAAMTPSEKPYLKNSVWALARHRILWLLVLMISAMITGGVLQKYEAAFAALPLLVTFIPMLTDTGGNAGSQSATLIIRGMALSEIRMKDALKVLWKELRVALLVGLVLSLVNYLRLRWMYPGNEMIALTVVISLFITVVLAKIVGGLLPMAAKMIHADPAIMASPLITTIVDAFSLVIYFSIAQRLLHI